MMSNNLWQSEPTSPVPAPPPAPVNLIPGPKSRRSREYEKSHPKFSYRLTDKSIADQVLGIAQSRSISADEVAEAFVLAGLNASRLGKINWSGVRPTQGRMTLRQSAGDTWVVHDEPVTWAQEIPPPVKRKRKTDIERERERRERDALRVHYRWSADVDEALDQLTRQVMGYRADEPLARKDGRKGEILTVLLRFAISAYQSGRITLTPKLWSLAG
jgi:hypothetical protein